MSSKKGRAVWTDTETAVVMEYVYSDWKDENVKEDFFSRVELSRFTDTQKDNKRKYLRKKVAAQAKDAKEALDYMFVFFQIFVTNCLTDQKEW